MQGVGPGLVTSLNGTCNILYNPDEELLLNIIYFRTKMYGITINI